MMLTKEEDLVPEDSAKIYFETITKESDDPLKEKKFTGSIISFKVFIKIRRVFFTQTPKYFICFKNLFMIC